MNKLKINSWQLKEFFFKIIISIFLKKYLHLASKFLFEISFSKFSQVSTCSNCGVFFCEIFNLGTLEQIFRVKKTIFHCGPSNLLLLPTHDTVKHADLKLKRLLSFSLLPPPLLRSLTLLPENCKKKHTGMKAGF